MKSVDMIECTAYIMRPSLMARCLEVGGKVYANDLSRPGLYRPITFMPSDMWLGIVDKYIVDGHTSWDKVKTSVPANRIILSS